MRPDYERPIQGKTLLGQEVDLIVDRPLGSRHPVHGYIYPVNYGYLPGVQAGDGEPMDAYVLGVFTPLSAYRGQVIAIIHRRNDVEDKLVVAKEEQYSKEQIKALTEFQERFFETEILCFLKKSIRNTVRGLARRGEHILVSEEVDRITGEVFYLLPGGGIEYQETSLSALQREFMEELETPILGSRILSTIENLFAWGHEISLVYEVTLPETLYAAVPFHWVHRKEFLQGEKTLYPRGLLKII